MLRTTVTMTGWEGAPYYSTMYFGGSTAGEATVAAAAVRKFWDSIKGYLTTGGLIRVIGDVDQVDPATGLIVATYPTSTLAITTTGNAPLPKATQGLIRWRTGDYVSGKEIRGRTFVPALANDAQVVGKPSGPFAASLGTAATTLLTDAAPAGDMVVYSKRYAQYANIISNSVWDQFAVMRSRRD